MIGQKVHSGWVLPKLFAEQSFAVMLLAGCGVAEEGAAAVPETELLHSSRSFGSDLMINADDEEREPFDEDTAKEAAEIEISDETYVGIGRPHGCAEDCSGHEAGFRYRSDSGFVGYDADSPSFNEGGQGHCQSNFSDMGFSPPLPSFLGNRACAHSARVTRKQRRQDHRALGNLARDFSLTMPGA